MPPSRVSVCVVGFTSQFDLHTDNILFNLPYEEERYQQTLEVRKTSPLPIHLLILLIPGLRIDQ